MFQGLSLELFDICDLEEEEVSLVIYQFPAIPCNGRQFLNNFPPQ